MGLSSDSAPTRLVRPSLLGRRTVTLLASAALLLGCVGTREARRGGAKPLSEQPLITDFAGPTAPRFVGRFDQTATGGPVFAWSGSSITVRFEGTALSADLRESGENRYLVVVDGKERADKIVPGPGTHTVDLVSDLPRGQHTLTLYRLTEPLVGETQLLGLRVSPGGQLLPTAPALERRIEIIGDSISTGYGNEGKDPTCGFSPSTENHYETYGAIAARSVNAELVTIAWSGRGVFSNRGSTTETEPMPELWLRTLPTKEAVWDFSRYAPQAVVINLGTNDFAPEVADTTPFAKAYETFVGEVRHRYPDAQIFCTVGPLLTDSYPPGKQALTTVRAAVQATVAARNEAGDAKVSYLEYGAPQAGEGLGCDYHPTIATQKRMATTLTAALKEKLGW
jgi:lysophospholipase L1-like esterase